MLGRYRESDDERLSRSKSKLYLSERLMVEVNVLIHIMTLFVLYDKRRYYLDARKVRHCARECIFIFIRHILRVRMYV